MPEMISKGAALKSARKRKEWSQNRLAVALEQSARVLGKGKDLPPGGRQTLVQYISYFENGKRDVPDRLKPIFRETFQATDDELGLTGAGEPPGLSRPPDLPAAHLRSSGSAVVASLRRVLETNVEADARIGPPYLIPAIQGQVPVVEQICRVTRGPEHEDALRLGSQFTEFCGWLYQDSGDYECAMYWTDRSLEYAAELDDRRVISYVLMRKSNIATDAGQPGHGLGLANAALKQDQQLTPRLRAVALRQRANTYAMLGEPACFARDVEDAHIHADAGVSQLEADLAPYCTPWYVAMEAGASWIKLNAMDSAIPVFEDSRTKWGSAEQVRDQALCLARLATAYAKAGEPGQACAVIADLIAIADDSAQPVSLLRSVSCASALSPGVRRQSWQTGCIGWIRSGTRKHELAGGRSVHHLLPTSTSADEGQKSSRAAVLPIGSFEQHGSYLPLITDTAIATTISAELASAYPLLELPPITMSCSHEHSAWPGTVSISAATLSSVVTDVADSVHRSGIAALIMINGHGGNYVLSNLVQQANAHGDRTALFPTAQDWKDARSAAHLESSMHEDMHAGEIETSILLHAHPELVRNGYETADCIADDRRYLLVRGMSAYTTSGVIGRPSLASPEKGKAILTSLVQSFVGVLDALDV